MGYGRNSLMRLGNSFGIAIRIGKYLRQILEFFLRQMYLSPHWKFRLCF